MLLFLCLDIIAIAFGIMEDSSGTAGGGGEMRNENSAQKYLLVDLLELKQISYDGFYIKVYPFIICYFLEIPHGTKVSTLCLLD